MREILDLSEDIKKTLKEWNLLKERSDYKFFYKIRDYKFDDKIAEFGKAFLVDVIDLIKEREEAKIHRAINRIQGKKNRILIADTYINIRKGYQKIMENCNFKLSENYCSMAGENCAPYICPIILRRLTNYK